MYFLWLKLSTGGGQTLCLLEPVCLKLNQITDMIVQKSYADPLHIEQPLIKS